MDEITNAASGGGVALPLRGMVSAGSDGRSQNAKDKLVVAATGPRNSPRVS
jgi:hypothetical protein